MNAFKNVNQNIRNLEGKIRQQTVGLTLIMREIENNSIMKFIRNAINYYDGYVKNNGAANYAADLGGVMRDVEAQVQGLWGSIAGLFDAYNNAYARFDNLFDFMTYFSTILTKTKLAISVGCIYNCNSKSCKIKCNDRER